MMYRPSRSGKFGVKSVEIIFNIIESENSHENYNDRIIETHRIRLTHSVNLHLHNMKKICEIFLQMSY